MLASAATAWVALLVAVVLALGVRRRDPLEQLLALETATALVVAVLALQALAEGEPAYLDAAFAVALLSYAETLLVTRWIRRRRPFP